MTLAPATAPPATAWLNGHVVPWADATHSVADYGLNYGMAVFEGIRSYQTADGPAVFRLDAHLDRLFASAATYGITLPFTREQLTLATGQVARAAQDGRRSTYIRVICWLGVGVTMRHQPVEVAVLAWPWGTRFTPEQARDGVRVGISRWRKIHTSMLPSTAKGCGQYLSSLLSVRDVMLRGFDEALLLDAAGNLAEGPAENLFLVRGGTLVTNDESSSILLGITRASVIEIARDLGIPVEVRTLHPDELRSTDEAFFTGTQVEIARIREVEGVRIGTPDARESVVERIRGVLDGAVSGQSERYRAWLHLPGADEPERALEASASAARS